MRSSSASRNSLEVANALPVLHRRFGDAVVGARLTALGDAGGGDLGDDLVDGGGNAHDATGAGQVAAGAEADRRVERLLVREALDEVGDGVEHPVALEHVALVREVDRGQLEV